jgi:hypothetical protein
MRCVRGHPESILACIDLVTASLMRFAGSIFADARTCTDYYLPAIIQKVQHRHHVVMIEGAEMFELYSFGQQQTRDNGSVLVFFFSKPNYYHDYTVKVRNFLSNGTNDPSRLTRMVGDRNGRHLYTNPNPACDYWKNA